MQQPPGGRSPAEAWLGSALDQLTAEVARFAATFAAFAIRPGHAAHAWSAGQRSFMNPLGFVAAAAGVYWTIFNVLQAVWPVPEADAAATVAAQLTSAVGPQLHYGLLGIALHFGLRALGSRRSIRGSTGVSFFIGGSLGTALALIVAALAQYFGHVRGTGSLEVRAGDALPLALALVAALAYAVVCLALARAMSALHAVAAWKAGVAVLLAIAVTAFLFGVVLPDGSYGWHPYLAVQLRDGLRFSFGFRG